MHYNISVLHEKKQQHAHMGKHCPEFLSFLATEMQANQGQCSVPNLMQYLHIIKCTCSSILSVCILLFIYHLETI